MEFYVEILEKERENKYKSDLITYCQSKLSYAGHFSKRINQNLYFTNEIYKILTGMTLRDHMRSEDLLQRGKYYIWFLKFKTTSKKKGETIFEVGQKLIFHDTITLPSNGVITTII